MPRGRYALVALAHVLLLGGLLWGMVWGEFNYLPPVSALAYFAGIGVLASLVAATIRRMRDAGIRGLLLLCVPAWLGGVLMIHLLYWWLSAALPMLHPDFQLDERLGVINSLLLISGALLASGMVAMLCAPSAPRRGYLPPAKEPALVTIFARSFCIRRKAPLSEFCGYVPLAMTFLCVLNAILRHYVTWADMRDPFPISHPQYILLIPFILVPACAVLVVPAISVSLRRVRDAGHFRRWLTALFFLVVGTVLFAWIIVVPSDFPNESPLISFYTSAFPLYHTAFALYTFYIFTKRGEK